MFDHPDNTCVLIKRDEVPTVVDRLKAAVPGVKIIETAYAGGFVEVSAPANAMEAAGIDDTFPDVTKSSPSIPEYTYHLLTASDRAEHVKNIIDTTFGDASDVVIGNFTGGRTSVCTNKAEIWRYIEDKVVGRSANGDNVLREFDREGKHVPGRAL